MANQVTLHIECTNIAFLPALPCLHHSFIGLANIDRVFSWNELKWSYHSRLPLVKILKLRPLVAQNTSCRGQATRSHILPGDLRCCTQTAKHLLCQWGPFQAPFRALSHRSRVIARNQSKTDLHQQSPAASLRATLAPASRPSDSPQLPESSFALAAA